VEVSRRDRSLKNRVENAVLTTEASMRTEKIFISGFCPNMSFCLCVSVVDFDFREVFIVTDPSNESYIQSLFAERIGGAMFGKEQKIYKFEKIKRAKRAALAANPGMELIDLGVGEPDEMAFPPVVKKLQREAEKPENRGYADNGIQESGSGARIWRRSTA
jgi:hypothetical protein